MKYMRTSLFEYCRQNGTEYLLDEWNAEENSPLTPENVTSGASKKVHWRCKKGHCWSAAVYSRTHDKTGCPFCAGKRVIRGENDLATIAPQLCQSWDMEKTHRLHRSRLCREATSLSGGDANMDTAGALRSTRGSMVQGVQYVQIGNYA